MTNNLPELSGPISIESYADNLKAKMQMAEILLKSGMCPTAYRTPESVLGAVLYGRELGFSPIRALHAINVIQGKPTLSAEGLKALAIQHGAKIETVEWTVKTCTLKCTRGDWAEVATFTIEDAALQGLTARDNWKRMPKAMLYARCVSVLIRNMFPDVIGGLYSAEEMKDAPVHVLPVKEVTQAQIDKTTGEILGDDMPEWMESSAEKAKTPLQLMKDAIDGEDVGYIANHKITSRNDTQGMLVRDAVAQHYRLVRDNLYKFNQVDRIALQAYLAIEKETAEPEPNI